MGVTKASCEVRNSMIVRVYKIRDSKILRVYKIRDSKILRLYKIRDSKILRVYKIAVHDTKSYVDVHRLAAKCVALRFYVSIRSLYVSVIFTWIEQRPSEKYMTVSHKVSVRLPYVSVILTLM